VVVSRAESGQEYPKEKNDDWRIAPKLPQPHDADRDEGKIRNDVPEIRYAQQRTLVGELVIGLILRDGRQEQQSREGGAHQAQERK
jgi:hypothetical protein